jgi:hypothetical protein
MKTNRRTLRPSRVTTHEGWTYWERSGGTRHYVLGGGLDTFKDGTSCVLIRLFRRSPVEQLIPLSALIALTLPEFDGWVNRMRTAVLDLETR